MIWLGMVTFHRYGLPAAMALWIGLAGCAIKSESPPGGDLSSMEVIMKMPWEMNGAGRPLVLVPGGLTGWVSWEPIAERLSETRQVVRVQLLSVQWGLDGKPLPPDYSPETETTALVEVLQSSGVTPPVDIAAWSYGAMIALDLALDHPEWVRTLTLIEPPAHWVLADPSPEAQRRHENYTRVDRDNLTDEDLEWFLLVAGLVPAGTNPRELPQWSSWSRHRQSLRALPALAEYQRDRQQLSEISAPALLVKGTGSSPVEHEIADALAERLPNAQVAEWPSGHAPHLVSTEPFLERMKVFQEQGE